ncbi:MAG: ABC transporter ATP-binding protein/permease [Firmicutes bacterium]|nr:ABC transporter ATP-binding protein/permease [Bacillota bacterium]
MADTSKRSNQHRGPMGGPPGARGVEKPKNMKVALSKFVKELNCIKIPLILTIIFSIIAITVSIFVPKLTGKALTEIFNLSRNQEGSTMTKIVGYLLTMALLYLINYIFNLFSQILMGKASVKVAQHIRTKLKEKLNRLPLSYFDNRETGDVLSVFVNDVDNIQSSLQQSLNQLINCIITVVGVFVMMLTINFWLTLIVVVLLPLAMLLSGFVLKHSQKYFTRQANDLGAVNGHIEETYTNQKTVKAYTNEDKAIAEFEEKNARLYESGQKSNFYSGLLMPLINFATNFGYVVLSLVSCIFILNGLKINPAGTGFGVFDFALEIGYLTTFLNYSQDFTKPLTQLAQIFNVFQTTLAASERVFEILDAEEEPKFEVTNTLGKLEGHVTLEHLTFGYTPDKILLKDVNCDIPQGKMVAIVGPTGAGKTTLVNLIMRFYELNGGKITIDGVDIKTVSRSNLKQKIGMVLQDTWLFNGTIRDNLKYGNPNISDEEMISVCESVKAHHFITTLENGYDTIINETGTNISQGQKQLLTIARAILAQPDIMILDEATSNIDTRTEILIQKAMKVAMSNRTSFVIAHRLSTIVNADKILVVNNGDIVEQGNHNELMKQKGFYYNLYNSQFS